MNLVRVFLVLLAIGAWSSAYAAGNAALLGTQCVPGASQDFGTDASADDVRIIDVTQFAPPKSDTAKPKPYDTIVFHDPGSNSCDPVAALRYGHTYDPKREGYFGYHFYIARNGDIYQAAPLSQRTNHVKPRGPLRNPQIYRSNSSAIGITLVCGHKVIPEKQLLSAVRLAHALQIAYGISSMRVFGHGELQTDRSASEGIVAARATRTTPADVNTRVSYVGTDGSVSRCEVTGSRPLGCTTESQCALLRTVVKLTGAIDENTGYTLPTGVGGVTTDAAEAGYGAPLQSGQSSSFFFKPSFTNPLGAIVPVQSVAARSAAPVPKITAPIHVEAMQKVSTSEVKLCNGQSIASLVSKRENSIRTFNATYGSFGTWQRVRLLDKTNENNDAIAYAEKIWQLHSSIVACQTKSSK